MMESQKKKSLPLASFASVILGISASIFLSDFFSLYQSFPYWFDFGAWPVLFILAESLLAYLVGFVVILHIDEYLKRSLKYPCRMIERKEVGIVLATLVVILTILIGILGFSFKHLIILSYTIFVLALIYFTMMSKRERRHMLYILIVGGLFLLLHLPVLNFTAGHTHLYEVSILEAEEDEDGIYLEIDTTLLQENGDAMNICVEMIFLEGIPKNKAECVKVVDFLESGDTSILRWSAILHPQNEKSMAYLFIWSILGENEYLGIEIKKADQVWKPFIKELGLLEYLKVHNHSRLKKIYQLLEILFRRN